MSVEVTVAPQPASVSRADVLAILTPLVDPAKFDTLKGERAANPRLRKICYYLESASLSSPPKWSGYHHRVEIGESFL
jgi:hypothetical protein